MEGSRFGALLHELWRDWFGLEPPRSVAKGEPALLAELRVLASSTKLFGYQNFLLPRAPSRDGVVAVIAENQNCWQLGYRASESPEPDGVVFDASTGQIHLEIENGFDELLYRTSVQETIFASPWLSARSVDRSKVRELLDPFHVVPALTDDENVMLPAIWSLPGTLVMSFGPDDLWAGLKEQPLFETSQLPRVADWFGWNLPDR